MLNLRTLAQAEVDFVVAGESSGGMVPVEVKYAALRRPERTRALRNFIGNYQPKEAGVVNQGLSHVEQIGGTTVRWLPLPGLLQATVPLDTTRWMCRAWTISAPVW
ncbi:MAG: hypothetical protein HXX19_09660 [Rhodoferax sp.]|nr:hypothetical protein [Rhodoferax sp.]